MHPDQPSILIEVFQGENSLCRDNVAVGEFWVSRAETGRLLDFEVRFSYDTNGFLEVDVVVLATGRTVTRTFETNGARRTSADIEAARQRLARLKFHPREALPNTTVLARANALFAESHGHRRRLLGDAIAELRGALESGDPDLIESVRGAVLALVRERS